MITSDKEYEKNNDYNELLYIINDINDKIFFRVALNEENYPSIVENKIYYYKEANSDNYIEFKGTMQDLKERWPNASNVPIFYEPQDVYHRIPAYETIYEVNLNTREIKAPEFISVQEDHNSEAIWFKVDRFFNDVDLFGCTCWIQYRNAAKEEFVFTSIPKVIKDYNHDVLYFPWIVSRAATKVAGNITFSFQFFKLDPENKNKIYYSIHTKSAISKVLAGLHVDLDKFLEDENINDSNFNPQYSEFLRDYHKLAEDYSRLSGSYNLYWVEA